MIEPGTKVNPKRRTTASGFPVSAGSFKVIKQVGTVPNFYYVESLEDGHREKIFVHEEDILV